MKTTKEKDNTKIKFHLGNPETVSSPQIQSVETRAFNERIQKIVVNADELTKDETDEYDDAITEKIEGVLDVEQEEEREQIRKEEEVHPEEAKDISYP